MTLDLSPSAQSKLVFSPTTSKAGGPDIQASQEEAFLPFLPMVYVAWSDGGFSSHDISDLANLVRSRTDIEREAREMLLDWLDPASPPKVGQLKLMLLTIRQAAAGLSREERQSLAQLGLEMARNSASPNPRTVRALHELEEALGVAGGELARELLGRVNPPQTATPRGDGLDSQQMLEFLDGKRHDVRQQVRQWLGEPRFSQPSLGGLELNVARDRTWEWCLELAARGLTQIGLPVELGGQNDFGAVLAAFQTLGYFNVSLLIKMGVQVGLFGGSLLHLGSERHRPLVKQAFEMELPGCFAMTERDHGSNVQGIRTTATFDPASDEFIIHTPDEGSRKEWIGNAARHGRMATVFAQLHIGSEQYGVHALLVPLRDESHKAMPGIRIEDCGHKLGLNGVDNGKIWFNQVRVPRDNLLDRYAQVDRQGTYSSTIPSASKRFFTMIGTLVMGRVSLAVASVSGIKTGVALAVEYGEKRRQFGPAGQAEMAIMDYQAHQRRLMPALATCYALEFATQHLVECYIEAGKQENHDNRELEVLAAGLKATASWEAMRILQVCRECCGGNGYLLANRFADFKADIDVFTTFEGDNTVLMQLVARGLLTSYRQQFSELKISSVLKYVAHQASRALVELNPISSRMTSEEHLRDQNFLRALFKSREDQLLVSVARRLKSLIDGKMDSYLAFNTCQDHLITLAKAHVERVVLEQFQSRVETAPPALQKSLRDLCDLYALSQLYEDRAWFLEHGHFEPVKSKAVRALMLKLCGEVRKQAIPLVRSFGIPANLMDAPMLDGR